MAVLVARLDEAPTSGAIVLEMIFGCVATISRALAGRLDPSFHLKVDDLRENMVNGFILPEPPFTDDVLAQFALVRRTATFMALDYASAGVTFVVDDTPIPESFPEHYAILYADRRLTRVLLRPQDNAVMDRLRERADHSTSSCSNSVPTCSTRSSASSRPTGGTSPIQLSGRDQLAASTVRSGGGRVPLTDTLRPVILRCSTWVDVCGSSRDRERIVAPRHRAPSSPGGVRDGQGSRRRNTRRASLAGRDSVSASRHRSAHPS